MKKTFTNAFLILATAVGFAQDVVHSEQHPLTNLALEAKPALRRIEEKVFSKKSFGYLKMGVSDSEIPTADNIPVVPGLGVGYRIVSGASALDLSASYSRRDISTVLGKQRTYAYTLPKANYLYFLSPLKNNSFYAGAGLAFGGVKTSDDREFTGIIPNVALGFEMNRNDTFRTFVQLDASQPAIAAYRTADLAGPSVELSLGAGF